MVQVVLPNDANPLGFILGGTVMHLIDIAGAIACHRHTRSLLVTAAVDGLQFLHPIKVGDLIILQGARHGRVEHVARSGSRGVLGRDADRRAADDQPRLPDLRRDRSRRQRLAIPGLMLETDEEKRRAAEADLRRAERLEGAQSARSEMTRTGSSRRRSAAARSRRARLALTRPGYLGLLHGRLPGLPGRVPLSVRGESRPALLALLFSRGSLHLLDAWRSRRGLACWTPCATRRSMERSVRPRCGARRWRHYGTFHRRRRVRPFGICQPGTVVAGGGLKCRSRTSARCPGRARVDVLSSRLSPGRCDGVAHADLSSRTADSDGNGGAGRGCVRAVPDKPTLRRAARLGDVPGSGRGCRARPSAWLPRSASP